MVADFGFFNYDTNTIGIEMNFTNIKIKIKNAFIVYGYYRTAAEYSKFSTSQLADAGISKQLLSFGASAYPWRLEAVSQDIPDNVTSLNTSTVVTDTHIMPKKPKAA